MTRPHDERPRVSFDPFLFSLLLSVDDVNWKQLFHTNGPYIGSEAPFPGPNDANKLRRSVASTHQQGRIFTSFDTFRL